MTESPALQTPLETLHQRLAEAPAPVPLKDLLKNLSPKGKNAPPAPDFAAILAEEEQAGRVFRYPSGKDGADRYWSKDEKLALREAVLAAATEPKKLNDLKKVAKDVAKADKKFADALVEEMVAAEELFKQASATNAAYGREKPRGLDKDAVRAALLEAAEKPLNAAALVKAARDATGAEKAFAETILNELIQEHHLHAQSAAPKPLYGKEKPRGLDKDAVRAALLEAAEKPLNAAALVKAAKDATGAEKAFAETILNELIQERHLHAQSTGAKPLYGKQPYQPPHPFEIEPGKKAFTGFVKAAQKLIEVASQVPLEEVFERLRKALAAQPLPKPVEGREAGANGVSPSKNPVVSPPSEQISPPITKPHHPKSPSPEQIRTALKTAYDELCLDIEFQDKVVEVRRLYHEAVRNLPGLSVEQFHQELEHLQHTRALELQALNEVQRAKEPELALHRGDRLLYFVIWR